MGQQSPAAVQIKQLGLSLRVLHPLRPEKIPKGGFAAPGTNQKCPHRAHG
jgi:hypothetical protein